MQQLISVVVTTQNQGTCVYMLKIVRGFWLSSPDFTQRIKPTFSQVFYSFLWLITQNLNTVGDYFVSSSNPVPYC